MKKFLSIVLAMSLCMTAFLGLFSVGVSGESEVVYLSDLSYLPDEDGDKQGDGSWAGWSDIKINQTVNGNAPKINNGDGSNPMTFEKAVVAHANAQIEYDISTQDAYRFMSYIGICYDAGYAYGYPSSTFEVKVDGVTLYKSEELGLYSEAVLVSVSIPEGAQKLTLITDGGAANSSDHTGWFDAKLYVGEEAVSPTAVAFEKAVYAAGVGETLTVKAVVTPENAETGDVIYGIEDPSIATVTADGKVYVRKAGSTKLTVKLPVYSLEATAELRVSTAGSYYVDTETWTTVMNSDSNPIPEVQPSANVLNIPIAYGNTNLDPGNALLMDAPEGDFTLTVKVGGGLSRDYQAIGLIAYAGHANMVVMTRRYHSYFGGNVFCIATYTDNYNDIAVPDPVAGEDAWLKLEKVGNVFTGYYSLDGETWTAITQTITSDTVANAEDLKIGVTAMTSSGGYVTVPMQDFTLNGEEVPFSYADGLAELSVAVGESVQLVSSLVGTDAYNTLSYSLVDEDIATIDENGVLTGKKVGTLYVEVSKGEEYEIFFVKVFDDNIGNLEENWTLVNPGASTPTLDTSNPTVLTMPIYTGDFGANRTISNLVLTDAPAGDFDIRVKVSGGLSQNFESVGLVAYHDGANGVAVERRSHSYFGGNVFCITNFEGSGNEPYAAETDTAADAYLRLVRVGTTFTGYYSYDGETWTAISDSMTNATVGGSDQLKIGLIARSGSFSSDKSATYTNFTVNGTVLPFTAVDRPVELETPTIEGYAGEIVMPETVRCYMASGVYKELAVTSVDLMDAVLTEAGSYDIMITVEGGYTLPAILNVMEKEVNGDLNGDGSTTIGDVTQLLDHLAGKDVTLSGSADFNEDGSVTIGDVTRLLDILAGK